MTSKEALFLDLDRELNVTRRVLERMPQDKFAWKPHEKSMSLGRLAMHVATLPQWMHDTLTTDGLDMLTAKGPRTEANDLSDLLAEFDRHAANVRNAVSKSDDATLSSAWKLRKGDAVLFENTRAYVVRVWCLNHMIHHRAQLCVLLRLLNLPVPAVYFNSSDEPEWTFA